MATRAPNISVEQAGPYSRHMPALDGLRGVAILGVVASHLFPGRVDGRLEIYVRDLFTFGAVGVDLFFVLSGFLITGILVDSLGDPGYFRKFYVRRCLRIFPIYYGVLLCLLLATPWLPFAWHGELWSFAFYLQNTNVATPIYAFNSAPIDLSHFWSLAVEEQFYLVWPLLVYVLRAPRKLVWACFGLGFAAFLMRFVLDLAQVDYHAIHVNTFCRADSLLAGGALAILLRTEARDRVLRVARFLPPLGLLAFFMYGIPRYPLPDNASLAVLQGMIYTGRYALLALASVGLIAWCLTPSLPQRCMQLRTLRFFGKYSYGIYIYHLILFSLINFLLRDWAEGLNGNKGLRVILMGLLSLALSILVAYLSYNVFEKKFLRLKRFFAYERPVPAA